MNIEIQTNLGVLLTDTIQLFLPTSKHSEIITPNSERSIETMGHEFEEIETNRIPRYKDVTLILETSKLKELCERNNIDQLDIDFMFMKSAYFPFEDYKKSEFKDGSSRRFIDVFPENRLKYFYSSARSHLKEKKQTKKPIKTIFKSGFSRNE